MSLREGLVGSKFSHESSSLNGDILGNLAFDIRDMQNSTCHLMFSGWNTAFSVLFCFRLPFDLCMTFPRYCDFPI